MELIQTFEDHEVRQLLMGKDTDLETAFALIDAHLRKRFVKGARERLPGLLPEDLADAWPLWVFRPFVTVRYRASDRSF